MSSPQPILQEKVRPHSSVSAHPRLTASPLQQPSIYPSPHAPITLIESPPPLAAHVAVAREAVTDVLGDVKVQINKGVDKWVKWERVVERTYRGTIGFLWFWADVCGYCRGSQVCYSQG